MTARPDRPLVLVADRLPGVVTLMRLLLTSRDFDVEAATGAEELRDLFPAPNSWLPRRPDVALICMTGADTGFGIEAAEALRGAAPDIPIVLLCSTESAGLAAAAIGADDEVAAPWDVDMLEFRIRAAVRRSEELSGRRDTLVAGTLRIDLRARTALRAGVPLALLRPEWLLLEVLAVAGGESVAAEVLLERVWGPGYRTDEAYLKAWINRLNGKLSGPGTGAEPLVQLVPGGYALALDGPARPGSAD